MLLVYWNKMLRRIFEIKKEERLENGVNFKMKIVSSKGYVITI